MLFFPRRRWAHHLCIPYETDFTLIGTTDVDHSDPSQRPECSDVKKYLIAFANQYFKKAIGLKDIVWTYSGVRPLYDDGALRPLRQRGITR